MRGARGADAAGEGGAMVTLSGTALALERTAGKAAHTHCLMDSVVSMRNEMLALCWYPAGGFVLSSNQYLRQCVCGVDAMACELQPEAYRWRAPEKRMPHFSCWRNCAPYLFASNRGC